mgnify:CR=1 FL=1
MVRINLAALVHDKVGGQLRVALDLGDTVIDQWQLAYLSGELRCVRIEQGILLQGVLETEVEATCIRCLDTFFAPITLEIEDNVVNLPGMPVTPERPVRVNEEGWADLTPLIREYIWLGLPINPICSPDCSGLCPDCGGNVAAGHCTCADAPDIDPRWQVLRSLLDES